MQQLPQISEAELEVMKELWKLQTATSAQLLETIVPKSGWKPKTVQTLLARLVAKKAVTAEKTGGKAYQYRPAISEAAYRRAANQNFLQKLYNGSLGLMLSSFIHDCKLSDQELDELRQILKEEKP